MKNGWPKLGGVLGIVYCIAGFFLIFLGWNGAASHDREAAQIPYVISGGIAGLGLVVVGAALIVAHSLRDRPHRAARPRSTTSARRSSGPRPADPRAATGRPATPRRPVPRRPPDEVS